MKAPPEPLPDIEEGNTIYRDETKSGTSETLEQKQARLFGGTAPWTEVHDFLETLPGAVGPEVLYELAQAVDLGRESVAVDVGGYGGTHAVALAKQYGCRWVALDLVADGLRQAASDLSSSGVAPLQADAQALPLAAGSVDLIWSRDMLGCVDPRKFLTESTRALRPGGHIILHAVYLTELITGTEREGFTSALALTDGALREQVEALFPLVGLDVVRLIEAGAGWRETELVAGSDRLKEDLLAIMRIQRAETSVVERWGRDWYETLLAWRQWAVFMALGKIEVVMYLLAKAPEGGPFV